MLQGYGLSENLTGDDCATVGLLILNSQGHYEEGIHFTSCSDQRDVHLIPNLSVNTSIVSGLGFIVKLLDNEANDGHRIQGNQESVVCQAS